ncbi:MAG: ABC transporter ATP-binding protein [Phormidesmis sp. RL_2_1]|nr:ABC transporter ATP-binding protein [Phormidesmis sp. RL_2_1]
MEILAFEQVTMRAPGGILEILKNLSFVVQPGDFIALVGPSGAGKTSLLRLMNRLSDVSSGTIRFQGQDVQHIPVVNLRRQVALVNQESRLLGMNVRETLGYPLRLQGRSPKAITEAIAQWAEQLNIPSDWMDRTSVNLSLGQRQRVAIARTLISEPKVLLLDEPTSSQDVGYSEFLLTRLAAWAAQGELTVMMSNHQLDLAARHVNRLLYLENGRLVADTPASQVDWAQLRQTLVTAEQASEAEWA